MGKVLQLNKGTWQTWKKIVTSDSGKPHIVFI